MQSSLSSILLILQLSIINYALSVRSLSQRGIETSPERLPTKWLPGARTSAALDCDESGEMAARSSKATAGAAKTSLVPGRIEGPLSFRAKDRKRLASFRQRLSKNPLKVL